MSEGLATLLKRCSTGALTLVCIKSPISLLSSGHEGCNKEVQAYLCVWLCVCSERLPYLPEVPAQQVHIRGNLFHNIAASCFSPTLEACTEGGGRDLGDGQTLCTRHSFLGVRRGQNPRWSFLQPCRLPACQNKCWIVENKLISFA